MKSAEGGLRYVRQLFEALKVDFKYGSRAEIEASFKAAKETRPDSKLFSEFIESQYAKNYQHFANMILIAEEEKKNQPEEQKIAVEDKPEESIFAPK